MSGSTVRSWFTPQLIITLSTIAVAAMAEWFALKGDVHGIAEEQQRQAQAIERQSAAITKVDEKIPDGRVIELRLGNLEKSVDPAAMATTRTDVETLKRDLRVLDTFTRGRISNMPWRPPAYLMGN